MPLTEKKFMCFKITNFNIVFLISLTFSNSVNAFLQHPITLLKDTYNILTNIQTGWAGNWTTMQLVECLLYIQLPILSP